MLKKLLKELFITFLVLVAAVVIANSEVWIISKISLFWCNILSGILVTAYFLALAYTFYRLNKEYCHD